MKKYTGIPDQLPTFILFENAEEISRFPEINSVAKASDITKVFFIFI